jgi:hypothetical protein
MLFFQMSTEGDSGRLIHTGSLREIEFGLGQGWRVGDDHIDASCFVRTSDAFKVVNYAALDLVDEILEKDAVAQDSWNAASNWLDYLVDKYNEGHLMPGDGKADPQFVRRMNRGDDYIKHRDETPPVESV